MATFTSRAYDGGIKFRAVAEQPTEISASVLIPAGTDLATSDLLNFMNIGAGYVVEEFTIRVEGDLDTNGTPTLTLDFGVDENSAHGGASGDPDFFLNDSTVGQAGGTVSVTNGGDDPFAGGAMGVSTTDYVITGTVVTGAATASDADAYVTVTVKINKGHYPAASGEGYDYGRNLVGETNAPDLLGIDA